MRRWRLNDGVNRFRMWRDAGLFEALWIKTLLEIDRLHGLDMNWQAMDGVLTKAPFGGEETCPNPTIGP